MKKSELITRLAILYPDLTQSDVARAVNVILDQMAAGLAQGRRIELRGFGSFTVKMQNPRKGRNPSTGAPVEIAAAPKVSFNPGLQVRRRLNP